MEEKIIPALKQDVKALLSEAGTTRPQSGRPNASGAYRKFENQTGKVYVPIIDVWTMHTGRKVRMSRKVFKTATAAYNYSVAAGNRYIKFVTHCKEATIDEEVRTQEG
jgi:hypothetical protein